MIKKKIMVLGLVATILGTYAVSGGTLFKESDSNAYANSKNNMAVKINQDIATDMSDQAKGQSPEFKEATRAIKKLSYKIFRELGKKENLKKNNVMISPTSIIIAMGMVEAGADKETLAQIEKHFGIDQAKMCEWVKEFSQISQNFKSSKVNIGNSIWTNKDLNLELSKDFVKVLKDYYKAQAKSIKFDDAGVKEINNWVNKQTRGMIDKIATELSPNTVTLILNAVAFEGKWAEEYEKDQIKKNKTFTNALGKKEKAIMLVSNEDNYFQDKLVRGFKKPYKDGYSFVAFQPRKGVSLEAAVEGLTAKRIDALLTKKLRSADCEAIIPEFTSKYKTDEMVNIFSEMGIVDVFSKNKADLSKMTSDKLKNIFVNQIIHQSFIKVDRHGTKAAALTEIEMKFSSMPIQQEYHRVNLNRPFIYAIVDNETNTPLFIGTVSSIK